MAALAEAFEDERDSPGPRGAAQRGDANDDEMDPHALLGVWAEQGASLLTMLSQVRHPRPRETNPVPDAICRGPAASYERQLGACGHFGCASGSGGFGGGAARNAHRHRRDGVRRGLLPCSFLACASGCVAERHRRWLSPLARAPYEGGRPKWARNKLQPAPPTMLEIGCTSSVHLSTQTIDHLPAQVPVSYSYHVSTHSKAARS